jgi:hypothetical protein
VSSSEGVSGALFSESAIGSAWGNSTWALGSGFHGMAAKSSRLSGWEAEGGGEGEVMMRVRRV